MKNDLRCFAWLVASSLLAMHGAFSVELKGAPRTTASAARSFSTQSGVLTRIDARSGYLVLDNVRRFTFTPGSLVVIRQNSPVSIAEVREGAKVSVTLIADSGSARVTELRIAP